VHLQAPNWEIVRRWRGQQEEQLLGRALTPEENAKLDRFLMHFERITRSMMAGGHVACITVELDETRIASNKSDEHG
jgi:D-glycerate 3-kinase